jgi:hypothetical protein
LTWFTFDRETSVNSSSYICVSKNILKSSFSFNLVFALCVGNQAAVFYINLLSAVTKVCERGYCCKCIYSVHVVIKLTLIGTWCRVGWKIWLKTLCDSSRSNFYTKPRKWHMCQSSFPLGWQINTSTDVATSISLFAAQYDSSQMKSCCYPLIKYQNGHSER